MLQLNETVEMKQEKVLEVSVYEKFHEIWLKTFLKFIEKNSK